MTLTRRFFADLLERTLKTFVQAYAGYWIAAGPDYDHLLTMNGLKVAVAAGALAVATNVVGKPIGNPDSGSILPPSLQPPAPKPVDTSLEPEEAAPVPVEPAPTRVDDPDRMVLSRVDLEHLARLITPLVGPAPPPPATTHTEVDAADVDPKPARLTVPAAEPLRLPPPDPDTPLNPFLGPIGGRDPHSEGNT